jgi:dynein heavy chain 1
MSKLLKQVRSDLGAVQKVCTGELKQTNYLRSLIETLIKGTVPKDWGKYKVPRTLAVNAWVIDFIERIQQVESIIAWVNNGKDLRKVQLSFSYLLVPEAYFTATRQAVAQAHKWSLEQLSMELDVVGTDRALTDCEFMCSRLRFEGAIAEGTTLNLVDETTKVAPLTVLRWVNTEENVGTNSGKKVVNIPIYLNATREDLLTTVPFLPGGGRDENEFYQLGVAIVCSALC